MPTSYDDAILHSLSANADHGKRRNRADKRHAVLTLLEDAEWSQWSDREIARRCRVGKTMVNDLRRSLSVTDSDTTDQLPATEYAAPHTEPDPPPTTRRYTDRHGNEATMNVEQHRQAEAVDIQTTRSGGDL